MGYATKEIATSPKKTRLVLLLVDFFLLSPGLSNSLSNSLSCCQVVPSVSKAIYSRCVKSMEPATANLLQAAAKVAVQKGANHMILLCYSFVYF